jgi:hypothetical protein
MPAFAFNSPLEAGKCAAPLSITTSAQSVTFEVNAADTTVGALKVVLVATVDWQYSDTPGSGRYLPIKAGQPLTIPMYDNMVIGVTASAAGSLGAMLAEGE